VSLARSIKRASHKRSGTPWPTRERPFRLFEDGTGYSTLHPTKGWMPVSAKRLEAQNRMRWYAEIGRVILGKLGR
jgi:hypothetical protein